MLVGRRRPPSAPALVLSSLLITALLGAGCDIPTGAPDFRFQPTASTPVIFEKTFVFLGPDDSGLEALIDTTSATFDSIFTVDPRDAGVYIVRDLEAFDLIDIDDAIDPIRFEKEDFSVSIGDLATQQLETSYEERIGELEVAATLRAGLVPDVSTGQAYLPVSAGEILTVPTNRVVDLSGAVVEGVHLTTSSAPDVNTMRFELSNGLTVPITDGSTTPGSAPSVVLETTAGAVLARASFGRSPDPGTSTAAILDVDGLDIPADARFRLDVSTASGFSPIAADPSAVAVNLDVRPLRYSGFRLSDIPASTAQASRPALRLTADVDLSGVTTRGGSAIIELQNTLPLPLRIERLSVTNASDVGSFAAGHRVVDRSGDLVPANASVQIPVSIGSSAVSRTVEVEITATTPATAATTAFSAEDGIGVLLSGAVDVDVLYYRPASEIFRAETSFALGQSEIAFAAPEDFVEVRTGTLEIAELLNGLDLSFDDVTISFPGIRTPPYAPGDTLVVRFRGTSDKSDGREFAKIDRGAPPRSVSVDLAGARVSAPGNAVRYRVMARSETAPDVRMVVHTDQITGSATTTDLTLGRVSATAEPFSANLTEDVNGDGVLDLDTPGEAAVNTMDDFGPLDDVTGLQLSGAELSVNLTAAITGDLVLYGLLAGEDHAGSVTFLQGRGALAVSPGDTMLQAFSIGGSPPAPDQMFALPVTLDGGSGPGTTRSLVLTDANSNISDFANARPTTIRFVGKALVGTPGGRIELAQPATVDVAVGISVPLNVRGEFELDRTEPADLTGLGDLTDPEADLSAASATLTLAYANGIPLGLRARLEFIDPTGTPTVSLPVSSGSSLDLAPAPADGSGYAIGAADGEVEFGLDEDELRRLAESTDLRIVLRFGSPAGSTGRIRASDRVGLSLRGDFQLNVRVGG